MRLFNCQSVKNVADKRMHSFKQKYSASSNSLSKLFIHMFAGRLFCTNSPYFAFFSPNSIALLANHVTVVEEL